MACDSVSTGGCSTAGYGLQQGRTLCFRCTNHLAVRLRGARKAHGSDGKSSHKLSGPRLHRTLSPSQGIRFDTHRIAASYPHRATCRSRFGAQARLPKKGGIRGGWRFDTSTMCRLALCPGRHGHRALASAVLLLRHLATWNDDAVGGLERGPVKKRTAER